MGQIFGFIIAMTVIVGGFVLIFQGKDLTGISAIIASLVALAGVFVLGRRKQSTELEKKAP
jgi:hypothetical protein